MQHANVKTEAQRLIDRLPDDVTWEQLMHELYVRQAIERGLADSEAGRTQTVAALRARFGVKR